MPTRPTEPEPLLREIEPLASDADPFAALPDGVRLRLRSDDASERVLLAWHPDSWGYEPFFLQIVTHLVPKTPVDILVPAKHRARLSARLTRRGLLPPDVRLIETELDTFWVRDFGGWVAYDADSRPFVVDGHYGLGRVRDDAVPRQLAARWGVPAVRLPIQLEGGHLVTDGEGRCVITNDVLVRNEGTEAAVVLATLREYFGCDSTVVVPDLIDEETGHVDVFVHVTGPGRALVGQYETDADAANAGVLDRTARMLRRAGFVVRRVPMPDNDGRSVFRTYTNALVTRDAVLVPVYAQQPRLQARALAVFEREYPGRAIVPIESDDIIGLGGALHCTALGVPAVPPRLRMDLGPRLRQARVRNGRPYRSGRSAGSRRDRRRPHS